MSIKMESLTDGQIRGRLAAARKFEAHPYSYGQRVHRLDVTRVAARDAIVVCEAELARRGVAA